MTEKKQLTITLSGGAGSGKYICAEMLYAILRELAVEVELLKRTDDPPATQNALAEYVESLRKNTKILLVDYRT